MILRFKHGWLWLFVLAFRIVTAIFVLYSVGTHLINVAPDWLLGMWGMGVIVWIVSTVVEIEKGDKSVFD